MIELRYETIKLYGIGAFSELREKGISLTQEVDINSEGPGSFMIEDPDGNPILFDQHR